MGNLNNALSNNKIPSALCSDSTVTNTNVTYGLLKENASWEDYESGIIPKTISIQNLTVKNNKNLEIGKLSRYIY